MNATEVILQKLSSMEMTIEEKYIQYMVDNKLPFWLLNPIYEQKAAV